MAKKINKEYEDLLWLFEVSKIRSNTFYDLYKDARAIADAYKSQLMEIETEEQ